MGQNVFEFRVVSLSDDVQVIDQTLKTPYDALTPLQMEEYMQIDAQLYYVDRMKREAWRQEEKRQKLVRNPFYRLANAFGIL